MKLNNRYLINGIINSSPNSTILRALDEKTKEIVALKRVKFTHDRVFYKLFKNEVNNLKQIFHENSVKYYESFEEFPYLYIVMELCDENLEDYRKKKPDKALSIEEIKEIFLQINKIFFLFNKMNLIHRDIKPSNILIKYLDNSHKNYIVKIADYGISKIYNKSIITISKEIGTLGFIAPEFYTDTYFDNKCDLFSLGIVLYILYFGYYPYKMPYPNSQVIINYLNQGKLFDLPDDENCKDLLLKLICEREKRIDWKDYYNHPFFQEKQNFNNGNFKFNPNNLNNNYNFGYNNDNNFNNNKFNNNSNFNNNNFYNNVNNYNQYNNNNKFNNNNYNNCNLNNNNIFNNNNTFNDNNNLNNNYNINNNFFNNSNLNNNNLNNINFNIFNKQNNLFNSLNNNNFNNNINNTYINNYNSNDNDSDAFGNNIKINYGNNFNNNYGQNQYDNKLNYNSNQNTNNRQIYNQSINDVNNNKFSPVKNIFFNNNNQINNIRNQNNFQNFFNNNNFPNNLNNNNNINNNNDFFNFENSFLKFVYNDVVNPKTIDDLIQKESICISTPQKNNLLNNINDNSQMLQSFKYIN